VLGVAVNLLMCDRRVKLYSVYATVRRRVRLIEGYAKSSRLTRIKKKTKFSSYIRKFRCNVIYV
jgi:hypothetical protein